MLSTMTVFLLLSALLPVLHVQSTPSSVGSTDITIPDQQAFVGKVFYYRLPLSSLDPLREVKVSEPGSAGLPKWMVVKKSFRNEGDESTISSVELIGIPIQSDRKIHFFHVKLFFSSGVRKDDVFVVSVVEPPPSSSPTTSDDVDNFPFPPPSSPLARESSQGGLLHPTQLNLRRDCILRIVPSFRSVEEAWDSLVSRLMPKGLFLPTRDEDDDNGSSSSDTSNEIDGANGDGLLTMSQKETDDVKAIQQWLTPLFTVNGYADEEEGFRYHITIDQQECDRKNRKRQEEARRRHLPHEKNLQEHDEDVKDDEDFEEILKKLVIDYHLIRIIRSSQRVSATSNDQTSTYPLTDDDDEEEEDDYFNEIIAPLHRRSAFANLHQHHVHQTEMSSEEGVSRRRRRRHNRRHVLMSTPDVAESWMNPTMSTVTVLGVTTTSSSFLHEAISPTATSESTLPISSIDSISSSTQPLESVTTPTNATTSLPESTTSPLLQPSSVTPTFDENGLITTTVLPDGMHNPRHHNRKAWQQLYTTPTLHPYPPTFFASTPVSTISGTTTIVSPSPTTTPTTTSTTVPTEQGIVVTSPQSGNSPLPDVVTPSTVPSTTEDIEDDGEEGESEEIGDRKTSTASTSTMTEETLSSTSTTTTTTQSSNSGIWSPPNTPPLVKRRIQKLSITAGSWFKFTIPEDTFWDEEDGGTRNLKLGFYLDDHGSRTPPGHDHWIQFDVENQFLYALPTAKSIGRHTFILLAIDSGGGMSEEILQINVRQHKGSRTFHHSFSLYETAWDPVKFPILISATEKLLSRIANQVFGDSSIVAINVQSIEKEDSRRGRDDTYTISWTNESLPAYPCPRDAIDFLFDRMTEERAHHGHYGNTDKRGDIATRPPSKVLSKILMSSEFKVKAIGLSLAASCETTDASATGVNTAPVVRNQLDLLSVPIGSVFRYKIPRDMFYSPAKGSQSLELDLDLLTIEGKRLPGDGCVTFHQMTQEIFALGVEVFNGGGEVVERPECLKKPMEYMLVARESESGQTATDAFMIEFVESGRREWNTFEVTMTLTPNTENDDMTVDSRIQLLYRLATHVFNDVDPSNLKIISFKKGKYAPQYQAAPPSVKKRRRAANGWSSTNIDNRTQSHQPSVSSTFAIYYEVIWTNKTTILDSMSVNPSCPEDLIRDVITGTLFSSNDLDRIGRHFDPEYRLLHIAFRPLGVCSKSMSSLRLGDEPVAVVTLDGDDGEVERPRGPSKIPTSSISSGPTTPSEEDSEREYYMTAILPAVITIGVMLIVALIIVCVLVKYRRSQEKTRFEVITTGRGQYGTVTGGIFYDGYPTERETFLSKGRTPVIFEQEMTAQHHHQQATTPYGFYSPVIMPPPIGDNRTGGMTTSVSVSGQSPAHLLQHQQLPHQQTPQHGVHHQPLVHQPTPPTAHHPMHQLKDEDFF